MADTEPPPARSITVDIQWRKNLTPQGRQSSLTWICASRASYFVEIQVSGNLSLRTVLLALNIDSAKFPFVGVGLGPNNEGDKRTLVSTNVNRLLSTADLDVSVYADLQKFSGRKKVLVISTGLEESAQRASSTQSGGRPRRAPPPAITVIDTFLLLLSALYQMRRRLRPRPTRTRTRTMTPWRTTKRTKARVAMRQRTQGTAKVNIILCSLFFTARIRGDVYA